ncbi:hypothetical protein KER68_23760, partial [Escherichia coli]|nr:hypothetical protein [Escherichia coli]
KGLCVQERRQSQSWFRPCFFVGPHLRLPYQLLSPVPQVLQVKNWICPLSGGGAGVNPET